MTGQHADGQRIDGLRPPRRLRAALLACTALTGAGCLLPFPVRALPQNGKVVAGSAQIQSTSPSTLTVIQNSPRVAIDWASFNIAPGEKVAFVQANRLDAVLNRVLGAEASRILGQLTAQGTVIITNPNGILFGGTAEITVGALIATTAEIAPDKFMAGKFSFDTASSRPTASIVNRGRITAAEAGLVGFVAPGVENSGIIQARLGQVQLVSANTFTIDLYGDRLINFAIPARALAGVTTPDGTSLKAAVNNSGSILADGGTVLLSAPIARDIVDHAVNMDGIVEARAASERNGKILLEGAEVRVAGTLDASGGGVVKVLGDRLYLIDGAKLAALGGGTIAIGDQQSTGASVGAGALLDASASDRGNGGRISVVAGTTTVAGTLKARGGALSGDGGLIETSGHSLDIAGSRIDAGAISGKPGTWLLDPFDLNVDSAAASNIATALATTNVTLQTTASGATTAYGGATNANGNGDIAIASPFSWSGNTTLTLDAYHSVLVSAAITAKGASGGLAVKYNDGGSGGSFLTNFGGSVTLSGTGASFALCSGASCTPSAYSLITTASQLQNIGLTGNYALANDINLTSITNFIPIGFSASNSNSTPTPFTAALNGLGHVITGLTVNNNAAGNLGLISQIGTGGSVSNLGLTGGSIAGTSNIGGLAGLNNGTISNSYASGSVSGSSNIGGLVGLNNGTITNSYAAGSVSGSSNVGGLVGSSNSTVTNSHYDIDKVLINGSHYVTPGGLFDAQYQDWLAHGLSLNIANYSGTLVPGIVGGAYTINSVQGMKDALGFADNPAYSFVLGADIDLSGAPGFFIPYLAGKFDGAGHALTNVSVNESFNDDLGVFGFVAKGATVQNIGVSGSITGDSGIGGLVGSNKGTITNSSATGTVSGSFGIGGLVGFSNGTVSNSYAAGTVNGSFGIGGLVGFSNGTVTNSHYDIDKVLISGSHYVMPGGLFDAQYQDWLAHGLSLNIANYSGTLVPGSAGGAYTINSVQGMKDALGFADNPAYSFVLGADIDLSGAPGLFIPYLAGKFDGAGHTLTNVSVNESFNDDLGVFGFVAKGATVQNIGVSGSITGDSGVGGLVGSNNGTVTNSSATGTVSGSFGIGGLVGSNNGTVTNSHYDIDKVLINGSHYVTPGGLFDAQYQDWLAHGLSLNIANYSGTLVPGSTGGVYTISSVQGMKDVLGFADNPAYSFVLGADIDLSGAPGFFIPYLAGKFDGAGHALTNVSVNEPFNNDLGVFGRTAPGATVQNIGVSGSITGSSNVGGLVGSNNGTVTNSSATGTVSGSGNVGGLVGYNSGTVTNSHASSTVSGTSGINNVGGLVGYNSGTGVIIGSYANSGVYASSTAASGAYGGLVGYNIGTINSGNASSTVSAGYSAGGLVGYNDGAIYSSTATGIVTGGNGAQYLGGLVGFNDPPGAGLISGSNSSVNVAVGSNSSNIGGLAGYNSGTVDSSTATGTVTAGPGSVNVGAFVGQNDGGKISTGGTGGGGSSTPTTNTPATTNTPPTTTPTTNTPTTSTPVTNTPATTIAPITNTTNTNTPAATNSIDTVNATRTDTIPANPLPSPTANPAPMPSPAPAATPVADSATATAVNNVVVVVSSSTNTAIAAANDRRGTPTVAARTAMTAATPTIAAAKAETAALCGEECRAPVMRANTADEGNAATTTMVTLGKSGFGFQDIAVAAYKAGATLNQPSPAALARPEVQEAGTMLVTASDLGRALQTLSGGGLGDTESRAALAALPTQSWADRLAASAVPSLRNVGIALSAALANGGGFDRIAAIAGEARFDESMRTLLLNLSRMAARDYLEKNADEAISELTANPHAADVLAPLGRKGEGTNVTLRKATGGPTDKPGTVLIEGQFASGSDVIWTKINGRWVGVDDEGRFRTEVAQAPGEKWATLDAADGREGVLQTTVPIREPLVILPREERRIALMISVARYQNPKVPALVTPPADIGLVGSMLKEKLGYDVRPLLDPSRDDIVAALRGLRDELTEKDQVIIYYAGHGYENRKTGFGYWLPADADLKSAGAWLSNEDLSRFLGRLPARQVMVVSDSCYSGAFTKEGKLKAQDGMAESLKRERRAVTALSSGGDEPVADGEKNSPFATALTSRLKEVAGDVAGFSLFQRVQGDVVHGTKQTPQYGIIKSAGYEKDGDFVLAVPKAKLLNTSESRKRERHS